MKSLDLDIRHAKAGGSEKCLVLIIGGSGHVGSYLIPTLIAMGHEVVSVSRGISVPYRAHSASDQAESVILDRTAEEAKGEFGTKIAALQPDIVVDRSP